MHVETYKMNKVSLPVRLSRTAFPPLLAVFLAALAPLALAQGEAGAAALPSSAQTQSEPPAPPSAGTADGLQQLLAATQENVEMFVTEYSTLRYEEDLTQEKLKQNEKVAYKQVTIYDSITRMRFEESHLRVDEQRLMEKRPPHVESRPLVSTNGFSTLAMVFHPYYEAGFRYTRLQDDVYEGKQLARVRFDHIQGKPSPMLYQMFNADRPIDLTGVAWIDSSSGQIWRIELDCGSTMNDMGLKTIRVELVYGEVVLREETHSRVLPVTATIDLETPKQHWRNIDQFTDYRKYRVAVNLPGADPK